MNGTLTLFELSDLLPPSPTKPRRRDSAERREYIRNYQRAWVKRRRDDWIAANGPCALCGSDDRLEVDHIDPAIKSMNPARIWSLSAARRQAELAKCRVLCYGCHKKKSAGEARRGERITGHRLTEDDVRYIRASAESCAALGLRFGVAKTTIARARRGEAWSHVA